MNRMISILDNSPNLPPNAGIYTSNCSILENFHWGAENIFVPPQRLRFVALNIIIKVSIFFVEIHVYYCEKKYECTEEKRAF